MKYLLLLLLCVGCELRTDVTSHKRDRAKDLQTVCEADTSFGAHYSTDLCVAYWLRKIYEKMP